MSNAVTPDSRQGTRPGNGSGGAPGSNNKGNSAARKKKGRRGPLVVGIIVLVVLLGVGAYYGRAWLIDNITYVSTDDAIVDGNHVNISAKMLGRIKSLVVEEGAKVEPGQLLVVLDDADLNAQEAQASASLASAKQNVVLAKVNLDKTEDDMRRTRALFSGGTTTREQFEHAQKALDTASAQYAIAQAQVDTTSAQLGVIATQLLNTRITAPIAGVVASKSLLPGDVVQPGQTIFTVNDLGHLWVTANFEETKISRVRVGAPVLITVDAYSSREFTGKVALISAGIVTPPFSIGDFTKTTQRVPVKILFESLPDSLVLLPGMSVEVKVRTP